MDSYLTRREFVKTGAVSAASFALFGNLFKSNSFKPESVDVKTYYAQFGIDDRIVQRVLREALSKGGDYCDMFFSVQNSE